jgi:hypothetical protein
MGIEGDGEVSEAGGGDFEAWGANAGVEAGEVGTELAASLVGRVLPEIIPGWAALRGDCFPLSTRGVEEKRDSVGSVVWSVVSGMGLSFGG